MRTRERGRISHRGGAHRLSIIFAAAKIDAARVRLIERNCAAKIFSFEKFLSTVDSCESQPVLSLSFIFTLLAASGGTFYILFSRFLSSLCVRRRDETAYCLMEQTFRFAQPDIYILSAGAILIIKTIYYTRRFRFSLSPAAKLESRLIKVNLPLHGPTR